MLRVSKNPGEILYGILSLCSLKKAIPARLYEYQSESQIPWKAYILFIKCFFKNKFDLEF